jgi:hypothetical protein
MMSELITSRMQVCKSWITLVRANDRLQGVPIVEDRGTDSTDLEKCVCALQERETTQVERLFTLIQFSF